MWMILKFVAYLIFVALAFFLGRLSTCDTIEEVADQLKRTLAFTFLLLEDIGLRAWVMIFK